MKETCCICLDNIVNTKLQCSHQFCDICIIKCLETNKQHKLFCPLCRCNSYSTDNQEINEQILNNELYRNEEQEYEYLDNIFDNILINFSNENIITFDDEIHIIYYVHKFKNIPNDYNDIYQEKLHPRWAWPKHRMSDYYKIYNIPQLII